MVYNQSDSLYHSLIRAREYRNMISKIHPIPAFTDNYIWAIHSSESKELAVVDPGDAEPVLEYLAAHQLTLSHILITHHHPDHTGGLKQLIQESNPIVFGPEPSNIKGVSNYLHEGDGFELFDREFEILEVPGHTLDHIAYFSDDESHPLVFCGDTLFAAGCGRLFEGTPEMMLHSLDKLRKLKADTAVYCTHEYTMANLKFAIAADGDNNDLLQRAILEQAKREADKPTLPSTISLELATNPFLRCDSDGVIKRVATQQGVTSENEAEVFAALRQWKDNF